MSGQMMNPAGDNCESGVSLPATTGKLRKRMPCSTRTRLEVDLAEIIL